MREIAALPPARDETEQAHAPSQPWGGSQRLTVVGTLLVAISFMAALVVWRQWPSPPKGPTPEQIQHFMDRARNAPPAASLRFYRQELRAGLPQGKWPEQVAYETARVQYQGWLGVVGAIALAGVVLIVVGVRRSVRATSLRRSAS